ncbi:GTPase family protein [Vibrio metschnikovii]|uniref:GTPase family protein n=1 Tax=Vibrio metschnikovii TaxID=28172 RepID=UPI001C30CDBB|nr:GTPase domain-containing protein [Vibrio metschnikovii]
MKVQKDVIDLIQSRNSFFFLYNKVPDLSKTSIWKRGELISNDIQVIVIGKSGYGKSTTLNTIVGQNVFETNDIEGCTRVMQSAEYRFAINNEYCNFSMADLPGIGENPKLDKQYINLYRSAINKSHVVIYILRADQRDYSIDHWAFSELFKTCAEKSKVIVAINAVDKIEPLNRNLPFTLSNSQFCNLEKKINEICLLFDISKQQVVGLSAIEDYNVDQLVSLIGEKLDVYLQPQTA